MKKKRHTHLLKTLGLSGRSDKGLEAKEALVGWDDTALDDASRTSVRLESAASLTLTGERGDPARPPSSRST